jgi:hypothetical protein
VGLASTSARADDTPDNLIPPTAAPADSQALSATPTPTATPAPPTPPAPKPLDLREPPFADKDFSWLNGSNRQPDSLLHVGPTILSLYVDVFYAFQFNRPIDHTIFPTTVAPRFNEIGLNLASIGIELPPIPLQLAAD